MAWPSPRPSDDDRGRRPPTQPSAWWTVVVPLALVLLLVFVIDPVLFGGAGTVQVGYGVLLTQIAAKRVDTLRLEGDGSISGTYRSSFEHGAAFASHVPTGAGGPDPVFLAQLRDPALIPHLTTTGQSTSLWITLLGWSPLLLLVLLFWFATRSTRGGGRMGALMGIGRSKATVVDGSRPSTTFADVAGYGAVKQEVGEIVDFLKSPARYRAAGATGPRGVLMVGPPGTGKTLMARAVAGEASVPFFSVTASSFVEVFVGVGASRVRDLFAQARKRAPAIVFIDEIDAIGERRGERMGSSDEREQTLNQLLAEMDGFDSAAEVVVLAATNRPDVLDPALLRPGRFDRQVVVPLPSRAERHAILAVHVRGKQLEADVDLAAVAGATPGFSGADLANLVNEAAIVAVRDHRTAIRAADVVAARERAVLGLRQPSGFLLDDERRAVAVHEAGHALVAALTPLADPVDQVTILPGGSALGATEQLPSEERHLYSEARLRADLTVRLGGRAAELVVFGEGSSGAASDLEAATDLATRMVREFGLSAEVGPVAYGAQRMALTPGGPAAVHDYSEATQRVIDQEVAGLLRDAERRAVELLRAHRDRLDALAAELVEHETVSGATVSRIAAGAQAQEPAAAPVLRR